MATHWDLDPSVTFLNHGSFGATPRVIMERQQELRRNLERNPVDFFQRQLTPLLNKARAAMAEFVHADPAGLVFVRNTTEGVNAVLQSLKFRPSDELLVTDHEYNACRNVLDHVARRDGAKVSVISLPFPFSDPQDVVDAITERVTPLTRLVLLDHITSPTASILPIERIIPALADRGVESLIDGAHAPGMLPLDLTALGATYYVGNCHKWMCAPKSCALLYVAPERREHIRPAVLSHGANAQREHASRLHLEFDWMGTHDPTAQLCLPEVVQFFREILPNGGWPAMRKHNRDLAIYARDEISAAFGTAHAIPDACVGSMVTVRLPDGPNTPKVDTVHGQHDLQMRLKNEYNIEVPIVPWGGPPNQWVRVSAQLYNSREDMDKLVSALKQLWQT